MVYAIGVDIGGTKIATVIINRENKILHREELKSICDDKDKMFAQVVKSIDLVLGNSKVSMNEIYGIGVGVPGKVDQENGIAVYQNNLPWHNFPLVKKLQKYYQFDNIQIDNDVHIAALAEWQVSKLNAQKTFVYLTVSTGISCAIIHNGKFLRGSGFAGEVGLLPVYANSSPDKLQRLEKAASGPAIACRAREELNESSTTAKDVFQQYQNGSSIAASIVQDVSQSIAHGVYSIICLLDPHKIIFGGGVMNNNPYLLNLIKNDVNKCLIPEQQKVLQQMQVSHFKANNGAVGAGLMGFSFSSK